MIRSLPLVNSFIASAETYVKPELEFKSTQLAYNIAVGYLLVRDGPAA